MNVNCFGKRIRIGEKYPLCFDIEPVEHETIGMEATFHAFPIEGGLKRAELRYKDFAYCLFLLCDEEVELPEFWRDSKLVWELKYDREGKDG